jgi:hypothetical protein
MVAVNDVAMIFTRTLYMNGDAAGKQYRYSVGHISQAFCSWVSDPKMVNKCHPGSPRFKILMIRQGVLYTYTNDISRNLVITLFSLNINYQFPLSSLPISVVTNFARTSPFWTCGTLCVSAGPRGLLWPCASVSEIVPPLAFLLSPTLISTSDHRWLCHTCWYMIFSGRLGRWRKLPIHIRPIRSLHVYFYLSTCFFNFFKISTNADVNADANAGVLPGYPPGYTCDKCDGAFSTKCTLNRHRSNIHSETIEKKFERKPSTYYETLENKIDYLGFLLKMICEKLNIDFSS